MALVGVGKVRRQVNYQWSDSWVVVEARRFQHRARYGESRNLINHVTRSFYLCLTNQTDTMLCWSDNQAIRAVQAALSKPKTPSFRLIECEFPPLTALNKLGDGSLQSANQVDAANLAFGVALCRALAPPLSFGKNAAVTLMTSASATNSFTQKAAKAYSNVHSLRNGLPPEANQKSIFILVAPSGRDYAAAQQLAENGSTVILVNGFAKVCRKQSEVILLQSYEVLTSLLLLFYELST